jgi:hypothetical protein
MFRNEGMEQGIGWKKKAERKEGMKTEHLLWYEVKIMFPSKSV